MARRNEVLDAAAVIVSSDRAAVYGGPEDSFTIIAGFWQTYLDAKHDREIHPHDVAAMLALLKVARLTRSPAHLDSWVDLAGYAACGGEVSGAV